LEQRSGKGVPKAMWRWRFLEFARQFKHLVDLSTPEIGYGVEPHGASHHKRLPSVLLRAHVAGYKGHRVSRRRHPHRSSLPSGIPRCSSTCLCRVKRHRRCGGLYKPQQNEIFGIFPGPPAFLHPVRPCDLGHPTAGTQDSFKFIVCERHLVSHPACTSGGLRSQVTGLLGSHSRLTQKAKKPRNVPSALPFALAPSFQRP
jgi:hypothetical protein